MKSLVPKDVVEKWMESVMSKEYSITIHPRYSAFTEKFIRFLKEGKWDFNFSGDKIIVRSHDPIALAKLTYIFQKQGYFISE